MCFDALCDDKMPQGNLSIPVQMRYTDGFNGSAFFFDDGSNYAYLVTARHMLLQTNGAIRADTVDLFYYAFIGNQYPTSRVHAVMNLKALGNDALIRGHRLQDVAVCRIGKVQRKEDGTRQVVRDGKYYMTVGGTTGSAISITPDMTILYTNAPVGNDIFVFGYPSSIGLQNIPQIDYDAPLLHKGILAGKNLNTHTLIIDCQIHQGSSGGPVMLEQPAGFGARFPLVGIVSEFIPFADEWKNTRLGYANVTLYNSGYAVLVPVDALMELLW